MRPFAALCGGRRSLVVYIERVPNHGSKPTVLLRESTREGAKTIKRTLANLSSLSPERIEALAAALRGEFDHQSGSAAVADRVFGVLHTLQHLARELGLDKALGSTRLARLVLFLVIARIAHQRSRLSAVTWAKEHAVEEVLGLEPFDEDHLYQALAWASEQQHSIEKTLFRTYCRRTGATPSLVLYDVTSVYLEGECNDLAAFGYNRDKKGGKRQIVVGLLAAPDGEPLAVRVFVGNTADPSTVDEQLRTLAEDFGVKDVIFVGDRGMVKTRGKAAIAQLSMHYITALTSAQIRTLITRKLIQPELFDEKLCEVQDQGKRFVLRRNDSRVQRERLRREDKLAQMRRRVESRNEYALAHPKSQVETSLNLLEKWSKKLKLSDFVQFTAQGRSVALTIDEAAMQQASQLDGCYVLETDADPQLLNTNEVNTAYGNLQKVERNFRTMKTGLLEIRPLFVRREDHTRGAVFVTMLALKLQRCLERKLKGTEGEHPRSTKEALEVLSRWVYLSRTIADQKILQLPEPDARIEALLAVLEVPKASSRQKKAVPSRKAAENRA
jgi:transposase